MTDQGNPMSEKPANYVLVNEMERLLQDDGNVTLIDGMCRAQSMCL